MNRESYRNKMKKDWKQRHWKQIVLLLVTSFILIGLGFFQFFSSDVDISKLKNELLQPTVIYDVNGKVASKISGNKNEGVSINEIPVHMKNAVVAIEDHRFYDHSGVDLIGISRAFFRNLKAGGVVEGGSTITQQLTKNALLSTEKTYDRKLEEVFLAREIEKEYSKDEILQMYLNMIYFGEGSWGIKQASLKYFGKEPKDLTIAESALIAGLIKAPSALNPYEHIEKAKDRRDVVLVQMKEQGMISQNQYEQAKSEKVTLKDKGADPFKGKYPYYVDHVLDEAIKVYGLSQDQLLTEGYKIYTEMDTTMQGAVENTYASDSLFPSSNDDTIVQSGAVLMDPQTGGLRAIVGGRGQHYFRGYNRATQLKAQPGSTMKPIAVYTPAIEEGWDIKDLVKDEPMKFGNYEPKNYKGRIHGDVPMYEAVKESYNIPAVWLLNEIGIEKGLDAINRFGIPLEKGERNLALALGGLQTGVSPKEMAEAYSVFPNSGTRTKAHSIKKIVDVDGNVVARFKEKKIKVTNKIVTDKMTTMLLGVVEHGTGKAAQITGYEVAGKTGSTQVPIEGIDGVKDQWFVGYTQSLVGAVWVGYDKTDKNHYLNTTSSEGAAVIFKDFMKDAVKNTPNTRFDVPHIATFMEEKRREEERKRSVEEQFKNEADKWKKTIEEETKKWEKKLKKGKGKKGH
ncbi:MULTISPECIES: transglycosylase domain-containing protein [unclassified Bacillus (in: firmicutes)]|uniref:transglycosylase domain-containing protein n=1 Tax=unclassified Bacillus (in: firmicutes) TaxID=185979 RepID=UPI0008F27906|nr:MULTISPECIES: penicillin-binding protein 1A [unclassified Bacillus (in: firmicutes)]SFA80301.1 penicillin-binding protein 2A [Bacillus sp. UNCCL13]SFQ70358.1 penicillin-binding protein 2A [Bacillus sp. cl95]